MSTAPETKTQASFGLTEGLVIAGIPAVGYWLAYIYELGYSKFFGIPLWFIRVDLVTVMGAILGMLGVLIFIYMFTSFIFIGFWNYINNSINKVILRCIKHLRLVTLSIIGFGLAFGTSYQIILSLIVFWLFFVFLEFGLPLFTQRQTKGYIKKIEAQQALDDSVDTFTDVIARRIGPKIFGSFFLLCILSVAAWLIGGATARFETEFWVPESDSSVVVIRHYGDVLVAAKYNTKNKTLTGEVVVMPVEDGGSTRFRLVKVGPLTPLPKQ